MAYNQNPIKPRNKCFSDISDQYRDLFLDQEKKKKTYPELFWSAY